MSRAAVLAAPGGPLEVRDDVEVAPPGENEVLVRMAAAAVCHSDLSARRGTLPCPLPAVLGHEGAGVIEAVGEGVDGLGGGDHVVVCWVSQCGRCWFCRRRQPHLCERSAPSLTSGVLPDGTSRLRSRGAPLFQFLGAGTFTERAVVSADGVVRIPTDLDLRTAALIGCGVLSGVGAATNTASIAEGDTVVVIGCGGVGLNVVQGARLAGAGSVVAVDVNAEKLDLATELGATVTVDATRSDPVSAVMDLTAQRGADVAFEVLGSAATIEQALAVTRRGGQTVLVGIPSLDVTVNVPAFLGLVLQDKSVRGSWYGSSDIRRDVPRLVEQHRQGRLRLEPLISERVGLDGVDRALDALAEGRVARSVVELG